jgi:hypothetical protein
MNTWASLNQTRDSAQLNLHAQSWDAQAHGGFQAPPPLLAPIPALTLHTHHKVNHLKYSKGGGKATSGTSCISLQSTALNQTPANFLEVFLPLTYIVCQWSGLLSASSAHSSLNTHITPYPKNIIPMSSQPFQSRVHPSTVRPPKSPAWPFYPCSLDKIFCSKLHGPFVICVLCTCGFKSKSEIVQRKLHLYSTNLLVISPKQLT